jgi:hypothetical protein
MPLPFSVNTIHPDLKLIKVLTRDFVVPIPFLTEKLVPIPSCREKSRDSDPAPDGIGIGFGKKVGIGTVPPDSTSRGHWLHMKHNRRFTSFYILQENYLNEPGSSVRTVKPVEFKIFKL